MMLYTNHSEAFVSQELNIGEEYIGYCMQGVHVRLFQGGVAPNKMRH
jgi:hypothetical protein